MITFLNQKRLLLDTDPQELARVKEVLKRQGIEFYVKTTMGVNALGRSFNTAAGIRRPHMSYSSVTNQSYVYYLYVRRQDYARAKKAAYGN